MKQYYTATPINAILLLLLAFLFASTGATYEITGTLVDEDDSAITGHQVLLFDENDEQIASDQTDSEGRFTMTYQIEPTSAAPGNGSDSPTEFKLGSSYPNPFNPHTTVPFEAPENTSASITIYNILGQMVMSTHKEISKGFHDIQVNLGGSLAQGQYLIRVQGKGFATTESMTFISTGTSSGKTGISISPGSETNFKQAQLLNNASEKTYYKLVVQESEKYHKNEIEVPVNENHQAGTLTILFKEGTVKDVEGNIYKTVKIGEQEWMAENLRTARYRNGDEIPIITDNDEWNDLNENETAAWTYYDNDSYYDDLYGKLYNWYAIENIEGLCPAGWKIPSDDDWKTLETYYGMSEADANNTGSRRGDAGVGGKLKSTNMDFWDEPNVGASNISGFSGLPGGYRNETGNFSALGSEGSWWSSSESSESNAWDRDLITNSDVVVRNALNKRSGFSVRCIRGDVEPLLNRAYDALNQAGSAGWGDGIGEIGGAWEVGPSNWIYGSLMGGEAHKGSDAGDQPQMNILGSMSHTDTTGFLNHKWIGWYEGITRANITLIALAESNLIDGVFEESDRLQMEAEARFIRGHFYFELRRFFNKIPWIDENSDLTIPHPNNEEIWPFIERDFKFAYDHLPETQDNVGRVNKWAAASYLAKTYVYQEKWADAKALYDVIIPNGQTSNGLAYDLVALDEIHNPITKNHSESIFAIQATADDGTGTIQNSNPGLMLNYPYNSPFRCCGFFQPSNNLVNAYTTVSGLPEWNDHTATEVTNDQGISSSDQFTPYDGTLDPRLDYAVGRRGVPFHDWGPHPGKRWVRDQSYSGPYASKKHIWWRKDDREVNNPVAWAPGSSYNVQIIRFGDVLLMAAEVEIELGNTATALSYINRVRERAQDSDAWVDNKFNEGYAYDVVDNEADMLAGSPNTGSWVVRTDLGTTWTYLGGGTDNINNWNEYHEPNYEIELYTELGSQANAREIVRFERMLELSLEGHRFFDLNRWGIAEDVINEFMNYEGEKFPASYLNDGTYTSRNRYFPIPQSQIELSIIDGVPLLEQNPGY